MQIGDSMDRLDTPALCVNLDAMESNIRSVAEACASQRVGWRPHAKCHKSAEIARKLVEAGAIGATCAKLGEAEVLAAGGVHDLLVANLIVGQKKIERLVRLRTAADPVVCVDHPAQAIPMGDAMAAAGLRLRVVIEVDIGMRRAGTAPGPPSLELARQVARHPGLCLAGVMGYEGNLLVNSDPSDKERAIRAAVGQLVDTARLVEADGLPCPIVSCGGTGTYLTTITCPGVTEVQPGGAVFMDEFYRHACAITHLANALTVVTTVVSTPAAGRAIVDAGRKTLSTDLHMPRVADREGARFLYLSAEHGVLEVDPSAAPLAIGDRLAIVPGYLDFTTVLHNRFYAFRRGRLECVWPLAARGRVD